MSRAYYFTATWLTLELLIGILASLAKYVLISELENYFLKNLTLSLTYIFFITLFLILKLLFYREKLLYAIKKINKCLKIDE